MVYYLDTLFIDEIDAVYTLGHRNKIVFKYKMKSWNRVYSCRSNQDTGMIFLLFLEILLVHF